MKINEKDLVSYKMTDVNVLVKIKEAEEVTKGGIILPDSAKDSEKMSGTQGVLINHGSSAFCDATGAKWDNAPEIGDTVFCAKYAGLKIDTEEGASYRLMNDLDVKMFKSQKGE